MKKKGIDRRTMLGTSAAVGAGLLTTRLGRSFAKGRGRAKAPEQVPRKVLGKTGQKIPILLLGAAVDLDPVFDRKLAEAVRYGVNYFDAATVYGGGSCEPAIGAYLKKAKNRKNVWITTKCERHDPDGLERGVKFSLKGLGTDYADLYYLHGLRTVDFLTKDLAKRVAKLKKEGKIRYFGFSCHHGNVVELLNAAAKHSWIDSVMFRYNFRQYGDKALNKAIDAAAKSGVGLIAMKTQGSAASFESSWKKYTKDSKWTKHQAVLKAVWADDRISAAVSHMESLKQLKENVAAAVNKTKLTKMEWDSLDQYANDTRSDACDGCDHICGPAMPGCAAQIGDTMRFLMYHDVYGERAKAKRLFAALPEQARRLANVDFAPAAAACPHDVDLVRLMGRAGKVLA